MTSENLKFYKGVIIFNQISALVSFIKFQIIVLTSGKNMVASVFMFEFKRNFSIFSKYFLVLICRRCSNKQSNISYGC